AAVPAPEEGITQAAPGIGCKGPEAQPQGHRKGQGQRQQHRPRRRARQDQSTGRGGQALPYGAGRGMPAPSVSQLPEGLPGSWPHIDSHVVPSFLFPSCCQSTTAAAQRLSGNGPGNDTLSTVEK